jgi:DHA2 family multidrug resistance protein-like MFS transporter
MVGTARLSGQALGAALVAWCLLLSPLHGTGHALAIAAGLALAGALVSFMRIGMKQ